ncbi:heterokaryon incompatibility protein-domain-containing protein [Fusarium oxysporum Fo47]|uniref:heterokaryon incompatibility protein-domain-containing protein n=1 Tax=Fusarium oxysporum Fo47 TaxID=660027 RepID=UPI0028699DAF|nr:heterokaryon incompatibility protein-domain-containing protein [Fusarium oxysporum Fo47]WJG36102.1 heterokaryon incompatibility protein-domain-containing protein [Fusarium oxysporum Fo47]
MSGQETSPQSPPANTPKHRRPWTPAEDATLRTLVGHFGASRGSEGRWKDIASGLEGRTAKDCRKRWLHSLDPSLRKGRWTSQEDEILLSAYARLGPLWNEIALLIPGRKDDQCSKRYNDILNPSAKNRLSDWTAEEDNLLRQGVAALGHRWVAISSRIPGRPPLTCRNRWRTLSRLSHNRQSRSQGTTPSSSSQMSPFDNGISPAAHNPNLGIENHGSTSDLMHFPMDTDIGHDQMGSSFLDSAFFDTFTGPSPSPLRESDPSDETETPNDVSAPGAAPANTAPVPDLSSNIATQTQSDPKPWPQPPKPPQAQQHQNTTNESFMPSPSTWSSLGTMLPPGTSPTDQTMWLGMTGNPPTPKNWTAPGPTDESNPLPQQFTITIITINQKPRRCKHICKTRMDLKTQGDALSLTDLTLSSHYGDPVRCTLHTMSLYDNPCYEALSYSWGDPYICHVIEVDGQEATATRNLYNALRRLRIVDKTRYVWADALCINQADTAERTHQVGLMRNIYSSTTEGTLWLGEFSGDGDTGANSILQETAATAFELVRSLAADRHWNSQEHAQSMAREESDALAALLDLSHDRNGCCVTNPQCHDVLYKFWDCIEEFRVLQEESDKDILVRMALEMFRFRHASDRRDCVYAYIGLGSKVLADYTIPYETAFKYVVRSLIQESNNLGPLVRIAEHAETRSATLPSWCPDYGSSFLETYENLDQEFGWLYMYNWYQAGGRNGPTSRFSLIDSRLEQQGIVIDKVTKAEGPIYNTDTKDEIFSAWYQDRDPRVCCLGSYEEVGWCELMRDMFIVFSNKPRDYSRPRTRAGFEAMVNSLWDPRSQLSVFQYQTFHTETDLVGHARVDVRVGDVLCVLLGGNMPFILRPLDDGVFGYVGQVFVHGIMDGEALQQGRELEWITLV